VTALGVRGQLPVLRRALQREAESLLAHPHAEVEQDNDAGTDTRTATGEMPTVRLLKCADSGR
jgi:hypothetical protein